MIKFLLYPYEVIQNIIGLLVIFITGADKQDDYYVTDNTKNRFGVSLGEYIIFSYNPTEISIKHERGHRKQSRMLGPLYFIIGILSVCGNRYDKWFHKKWSIKKRVKWYYNQPWEKWADKLGGVERTLEQDYGMGRRYLV